MKWYQISTGNEFRRQGILTGNEREEVEGNGKTKREIKIPGLVRHPDLKMLLIYLKQKERIGSEVPSITGVDGFKSPI